MTVQQYKPIFFSLLIGGVVMLSACKTPPIPPEPPEATQKPPPSVAPQPEKEDVSERIHEPPIASEDAPETHTASEANALEQQNEPVPPPADRGDVAVPSQAIPGSPQTSKPTAATASPDAAQTNAELTSDMDRELQESLSEFDGRLLKERKLLLEDLQNAGTGGERSTGAIGDWSTAGVDDPDGSASETRPAAPNSDNLPETSTGTPGKAERGGTRPGTIPPDIPDGRDDDIVARQIREAAIREDDPELRKKLWEEYRKYKQSNSARAP